MDWITGTNHLTISGVFITAFILAFSGAVMPGPVLAVTITHSARMGAKAGPLIILGHAILELALVVALFAGLGQVLTMPLVSGLIGGLGALILLWMGWDMLRSLSDLHLDLETGSSSAAGPIRDGILLSLVNPYWSIWWATVGLGLVVMTMNSGHGAWGLAAFYTGHITADLLWYALVAFIVAKGRRFLSDRVYRTLVGGCAVVLLGFGLYFGIFATNKLFG